MKKFLIILGCIFAIILVTAVGLFVYGSIVGHKLDNESKAWVDKVVPEFFSSWDPNVIINNGSAGFLRLTPRKNLENLFARLHDELGELTEYKRAAGQAWIIINNGVNMAMEYKAEAVFTKGCAQIAIGGTKEADVWKLVSFDVTPHCECIHEKPEI